MEDVTVDKQGQRPSVLLLLLLLCLVLPAALAWWATAAQRRMVQPGGLDAPREEFSAGRAMTLVQVLAAEPRPLGTPAHARARSWLVEQLEAAGVEVEIQVATVLRPSSRGAVRAAKVHNVLARLAGRPAPDPASPAVLLMAHYDSVPWSPGAGDDASGVACLLETLRALQAGPALTRDVFFLFTDGEEGGLWGARAFVDEHPWAARVGVVVNADARGNTGPSLMFRTSGANLWSVRQLRQAVPAPLATSLSYEVFRLMPNDTDLAVFAQQETPGLDFAFIGNHPRYHSARDTADRLDPFSLQHQGSSLLGLARHLAAADLKPTELTLADRAAIPPGDGVYFNLFGPFLVIYPASWALPLAIGGLALFVLVVVLLGRRGKISLSSILGAAFGVLVAAAVVGGLLYLAGQQILLADPDFQWLPRGTSYEEGAYASALICLLLGLAAGAAALLVRVCGAASLSLGAALLALVPMVAAAWKMPGLSYAVLWPLVGALLVWCLPQVSQSERSPTLLTVSATVAATVAGILLLAPIVPLLLQGLGLSMVWALGVLAVVAFALVAPWVELWTRRWPALLPLLLVVAGIAQLVPLVQARSFDEDTPRATSLAYAVDPKAGKALWLNGDPRLEDSLAGLFAEPVERDEIDNFLNLPRRYPVRGAKAPVEDLAAPEIRLVERQVQDDGQYRVVLQLQSRRQAPVLALAVETLAHLSALRVNGQGVELAEDAFGGGSQWVLQYQGDGGGEVEVELRLQQMHPLELRLVDMTWGLPPVAPPRPAQTMPRPQLWWSDATLVASRAFY
jgi:hypothetical protein